MRRTSSLLAAVVLASLAACTGPPEVPGDWARQDFEGGSVALPPASTGSPEPARPHALLSRDLAVGSLAARVDVYREKPPPPLPPGHDPDEPYFYSTLEEIGPLGARCPGHGEWDTAEIEVPAGTAVANVYDERSVDGPAEDGVTVVCATYPAGPREGSVQLVVQGPEADLPESVWRPLVASVRLD